MLANTQMFGLDLAFPDVCLTPPAIPIPYPNIAMGMMAIPICFNILKCFAPAHNMMTFTPISLGDIPGVIGGVVSHTVMSLKRDLTGAFTVLLRGLPATRLTSITLQNTFNMVGIRAVPSQPKVFVLAA
ncbi:MAG: DUF4150 domain-containing protein [Advenella sp.]|jgi:hypothetical protein